MKNRIRQLAKKILELEKKFKPREIPDLVITYGEKVLVFKPELPMRCAF